MAKLTKIQLIQGILGVDADDVWGRDSQAALDALVRPIDTSEHRGNASSFADPADIVAFKKWYAIYRAQGDDDETATKKAFAKGDNGIGCYGDDTTHGLWCALTKEAIVARWGDMAAGKHKPVLVTIHGHTETLFVGDRMTADLSSGAIIDLAPDSAARFGLKPPFIVPAMWKWA